MCLISLIKCLCTAKQTGLNVPLAKKKNSNDVVRSLLINVTSAQVISSRVRFVGETCTVCKHMYIHTHTYSYVSLLCTGWKVIQVVTKTKKKQYGRPQVSPDGRDVSALCFVRTGRLKLKIRIFDKRNAFREVKPWSW